MIPDSWNGNKIHCKVFYRLQCPYTAKNEYFYECHQEKYAKCIPAERAVEEICARGSYYHNELTDWKNNTVYQEGYCKDEVYKYTAILAQIQSIDLEDYKNFTNTLVNETLCQKGGGYFHGHPKFAFAMLAPVLVVTLFMLNQWWNEEKYSSRKSKIFTFTLVIFQIWPQYKMLTVMYIGFWKNDPCWREQKEKLQRNICCLGKKYKYY